MANERMLGGLIASSAVYGVASAVSAATGFLLLPVVVRHLSPSEYGVVGLAEMMLLLAQVVAGLGLPVWLLANYRRSPQVERRRLCSTVAGVAACAGAIVGSVLAIAGILLRGGVLPALTPLQYAICGLCVFVEVSLLVQLSVLRSEERRWAFVGVLFLQAVAVIAATSLLVAIERLGVTGMLTGRLVGAVAGLGAVVGATRVVPRIGVGREWWGTVHRALPLVPAALASAGIVAAPRFALEHFHGSATVGEFTLASRVAGLISLALVQPFALAWQPIVAKASRLQEAPDVLGRIVSMYVVVGLAVGVAYSHLVTAFSRTLWNAEYSYSAALVGVLILANVSLGLTHAVNVAPYATGVVSRQVDAYLVGATAAGLLGLVLVPVRGALGAAGMLLGSHLVVAAALFWHGQALFRVRLDLPLLLLGAVAIGGALLTTWLVIPILVGPLSNLAAFLVFTGMVGLGLAGVVRSRWSRIRIREPQLVDSL